MAQTYDFAKDRFIAFIEKYFLNGKVEAAVIEVKNNVAQTIFRNMGADLRGFITLENFPLADSEIGCYSTGNLLRILSVLNNEIDIKLIYDNEGKTVIALKMKDAQGKEGTFAASELDTIENDGKKGPTKDFAVKVNLNNEVIQDILKANAALEKNTQMTFERKKKSGKFVVMFGQKNLNSDKIEFELETEEDVDDDFETMSFPSDYIKEILTVNGRRFDEATMEISNKGVMRLFFKEQDIKAEYWVVKFQDN